ncbi:hypothetical protein [Solimicrobium silvestre]|uniref:Uncharacterized protein n=1 Tax=Solimicrobium silvestre TaxID=2099400 RepID=A0A2S9GY43_9BURK|nr:hypothetical protein [Solimicrobium silvestre]PRC92644.1 hypothetical protein S2091_2699 [Solimicrobium silvestre]
MKNKQSRNIAVQVNLTPDDYVAISQKFKTLGLSNSGGFQYLAKRFGSQLDMNVSPIVIQKDRRKAPVKCQHFPGRARSRAVMRQ